MTDIDESPDRWDTLAELAEAATPGPWKAVTTGRAGGDHWYVCDEGEAIASISAQDGINEDQRQPDAEFIAAANPATILRLIAENRDLGERLAQAYRDEVLAHDERDSLAAKVAAAEALADEWERRARLAESTADARAGLSDEADTRVYAEVMSKRAGDLRAALDTTTTHDGAVTGR